MESVPGATLMDWKQSGLEEKFFTTMKKILPTEKFHFHTGK